MKKACMLLAGCLIACHSALSQEPEDDEPVFDLSPFEVRLDENRGYTATSSLAGGRLSSELKDTAAAVTVLTTEFLSDIAAGNFLEAAAWAPNSVPNEEVSGASLYNDYGVQFRSLGAGFQSRNYFRWYINSDAYNTARVEFARGPNSIVFGDAGVGGVANVSSIQALGTDVSELSIQMNSFGGIRSTFDTDLKLTERVSVRLAGLVQRYDDWRQVGELNRDGFFLTTTVRPFTKTTIRAEFEWGELDRLISFGVLENYSSWDGSTFVEDRLDRPGNFGVFRRLNSDRLVYNSAAPELGIQNWNGFGVTFGTYRMLTTFPQEGLPNSLVLDSYEVSFQAPNGGVNNPYYTSSIFLQQQIGENLFLELAGNYQEQERKVKRWFFDGISVDINEKLPNGEPNPHVGEFYGEARYWREFQKNEVFDVRASLAYILDTGFSNQRFLAVAGYRNDLFEAMDFEIARTNGSDPRVTKSENRVYSRRYVSKLGIDVGMPPASDPETGIETREVLTDAFYSERPITYLQGAVLSQWFSDQRLHTMIGVRKDTHQENINDRDEDLRDPITDEFLEWGQEITSVKESVVSYNVSGVYDLTQWLSVFAGYSESYDPGNTALAIDGNSLPALRSEGTEGGIKLDLWNGRIVGSITYYQNEQRNNRISGESGSINNIWSLLELEDNQLESYSDRQTFEGSGLELDFTALPSDNWRILFNIAFPDTKLTEGFLDTTAYYNDNIAFWNGELARLEAEGDTLTADALANRISGIKDRIDSFEAGRRLNNTFDYTANVYTRYFFTEGSLKGFSIGGGANIRGERLVSNQPGDPFDYIYANSYTVLTLSLGYESAFRGFDWSFQLNIKNVLDEEIVRPTDYGTYRVENDVIFVPDTFHVQAPRQILLTIRAKF